MNYYLKKGTRFYRVLIAAYTLPPIILALIFIFDISVTHLVFLTLFLLGLGGAVLSQNVRQIPRLIIAIPIVVMLFYAGLIKGLMIQIRDSKSKNCQTALSSILLLLSIVSFAFYLRNNSDQFISLRELQFGYLGLIIATSLLSLFINGLFMKIVVKPFGVNLPILDSFLVSIISSAGNFFAPGGTGIGIRGVYLKKKYKLKYSDFTTTVAGNYIIVFLVVSLTGMTSLLLVGWKDESDYIILFSIFLFLFIADLVLMSSKFSRSLKTLSYKIPDKVPGKNILFRIFEGWDLIVSNKSLLFKLLLLAFVGYGISFLMGTAILLSLNINFSVSGIMLIVAISSLSVFVNITPGNIGIKEVLLIYSAQLAGLTTADVLSYSIIERTILLVVLFIGWISLHSFKTTKRLREFKTIKAESLLSQE